MLFGWGELSPDKVDTVITWFKPIKDVNNENINVNNAVVKKNMKSLYDSASQQVKDWTVVYNECMAVIERFSNTYKKRFIVKCKVISGKDESAWNDMKKNDFVLLFADTMKQILEEDKKKEQDDMAVIMKAKEERLRAAAEKAAAAAAERINTTSDQERYPDDPEYQDGYAAHDLYPGGRWGGGSKKKSRKRTTRNRRSSHRNRRHRRASTHKYKK
jgi:hypothetical protein